LLFVNKSRDLKAENVLLDASGHIIVTDFGIAKEISDQRERTNTICGTPEYLGILIF
jgi:serine/threonine protein kinase